MLSFPLIKKKSIETLRPILLFILFYLLKTSFSIGKGIKLEVEPSRLQNRIPRDERKPILLFTERRPTFPIL